MRGDQRYAGLFTKIHALYGKRLRSEDYKRMSAMHSLSELVVYLKRYPGWSGLLSSIDEYNVRRGYLESVIKRSFFQEYERLMHFVPEKDKELLSFPILQNEIELILEFLRCLSLNQLEDFSVNLPAFFAKHSKIKLSALQNARTYDELLAALRKTGYYGALSRLAPGEGRQIDYNTIELVLWQNFYESFLSAIKENYTGETRSVLLSLIGSRLDIENISRVMRIKANFDIPPEELSSYLININYKVDLDFLKTLFEAQSEAEQLDLLRNSKYRYVFSKMDIRQIKGYSQDYLVETCRKAILRSAPSVYIGAVYLLLKEAEIINLIRIIESIRYGVEPKNILPI